MLTSGFIKQKARKSLQDNWITAILLFLIIGVVGLVLSIIISILQQPYIENADRYYDLLVNTKNSVYIEYYFTEMMKAYAFELIQLAEYFYIWIFTFPALLFFMSVSEGEKGTLSDFKKNFNRIWEGFKTYLIMGVRIFLWSLLFILPGIIKTFSYALTPMIKAKNPERTVNECIAESERIMSGKKSSLFVLYLSFIGWYLLLAVVNVCLEAIPYAGMYLSAVASFIGGAVLNAYVMMSEVEFYHESVNPTRVVYVGPNVPPPPPKIDVFDEKDPFNETVTKDDDPFA